MRLAMGWFRLLVALHPWDFRRDRGAELLAHLRAEAEARAGEPVGRRARFVAATSVDLLGSALRLRLRPVLPAFGDARGRGSASGPLLDVRHAARALRNAPVLTGVIVITLALGVGMNTALFSVVDAVLLRPLSYRAPDRLVQVEARILGDTGERTAFSGGLVEELRTLEAFQEVAAATNIRQNLTGFGLPRMVELGWASPNLFSLLGVEPALGRSFAEDDPPGTVLLTHAFWERELGADPTVLGRSFQLDGHTHTVVGVLPPDFRLHIASFPTGQVALWKNPDRFWQNGDIWNRAEPSFGILEVVARLAPGVDETRVAEALDGFRTRMAEVYEGRDPSTFQLAATPLLEITVADVRPTLWLLAAVAGTVLLVACGNVMGLLLVRARERTRELALRRALGASRGRLARLAMAESLLLALAGGAAGIGLGVLGTRALLAMGPALPRLESVGVDGRVLAFALAVSVLVTLLVGLVPAVVSSRTAPGERLRAGGRGVAGGGSDRLRGALVTGQLALSLVLLVGAGLLGRSLAELRSEEVGFQTEDVLTFAVSLPGARYDWPDEVGRVFVELQDRLRALPGVERAGVMWPMPLHGNRWGAPFTAGEIRPEDRVFAGLAVGTAEYFGTLDIPLVEGRLFRDGDDFETVTVVSRRVAERAWPGESALGRTVNVNVWGGGATDFEVIGVVEDVRNRTLDAEGEPLLYFDIRRWAWADWEFHVAVESAQPAGTLVPRIRELVASMDPELPVADVATLEERVDRQVDGERFAATLVWLFSAVAGLLALVGLYGVVSYAVGRRNREIGIRMALGSGRSGIAGLVLGQGIRMIAAGVLLGLAGAWATSRFLEAWLYGVEPVEPATYAGVAATLAAMALLATWLPARRAAATDPVEVLRGE